MPELQINQGVSQDEELNRLLHIMDLKIILKEMIDNANRVMDYHNNAPNEGYNFTAYSQQQQFTEEIEKQQKLIQDEVEALITFRRGI